MPRIASSPRVLGHVFAFAGAAIAAFSSASAARAEVTYVVQRGHTLEAIAHRYHVTAEAIREANHLGDGPVKPGQRLVIPVDADASGRTARAGHDVGRGDPNLVHAFRQGEEFRIRLREGHGTRGNINPAALKSFSRLMRQGEATHPPDPRLVALIGIVSAHFDGKPIEVVSGFRAYTPTQYTAHSNHNLGKALDFRVRGVSNESLRDFCLTLRNTGCGYYPNSSFVHLDVRDTKFSWVDLSHPGEPPRYEKPGTAADEGMSDVPTGDAPAETPPAASAPTAPPAPPAEGTAL
jgi:uncharacterized protein YcbK (DUF882 family)